MIIDENKYKKIYECKYLNWLKNTNKAAIFAKSYYSVLKPKP